MLNWGSEKCIKAGDLEVREHRKKAQAGKARRFTVKTCTKLTFVKKNFQQSKREGLLQPDISIYVNSIASIMINSKGLNVFSLKSGKRQVYLSHTSI